MQKNLQAEMNIGIIGHVDHGKTTLTSKLTGKWTDTHSEEIKQGISIRLGYADCNFYKCTKCSGIQAYSAKSTCSFCGSICQLVKKVSFVDAPGHETLMAVMLSGATLLNGAILVIAANEDCPQPRTVEHFSAIKMYGLKNLVVAQNKIDLVSKDVAKANYKKIRDFLDSEGYNHVPIIPTSAHFDTNIDALIYALIKYLPTPKFDTTSPLKMRVVRSFNINKPGTLISDLKGGVLGGSIICGTVAVGDKVMLYPGINQPLELTIESLNTDGGSLKTAVPGGLIAIGTSLDSKYTFSDRMTGQLICDSRSKPMYDNFIELEYNKIERLVESNKIELKMLEKIVLIIGTAAYAGTITKIKKSIVSVTLSKKAVFYKEDMTAVSRMVNNRWRLSGYGIIK
ncbi:MAG: translation initiation factor IF-2 subunit gamma [archaeon]